MWDYDKLFAEGNVVGLRNKQQNRIFPSPVCGREYWGKEGYVDWRDYYNESLSTTEDKNQKYTFEIMYVVRLDKHGNVVEKLFDRDRDMEPEPMPELKTGMFIKLKKYEEIKMGVVYAEKNHVIYQEGGYDFIYDDEIMNNGIVADIIEVYNEDACSFNYCDKDVLIWRSPEYQSYLDSKN